MYSGLPGTIYDQPITMPASCSFVWIDLPLVEHPCLPLRFRPHLWHGILLFTHAIRDFAFWAGGWHLFAHGGARLGAGEFVEVHVSTSLQTCEERDPKNLYKKVSTPITTMILPKYYYYDSCAMVWSSTMLYTSQKLHCQLHFVFVPDKHGVR